MQRVYLTGATGFIGSHFVRNHLATSDYDVQCFVRGRTAEECTQRVKDNVRGADADYATGARLDLRGISGVPGDITRPRLGLSESWLSEARAHAGASFLHFASSLNFEERNKDLIYAHNIGGLQNAIEVATALGSARFVYLSTAYTVGVYQGKVPEQLHRPAAFNNLYEESKCAAEHLAIERCAETGMTCIIVRPSIVIGPSETCRTGGSKTGLYGFIREMARLAPHVKKAKAMVTLVADPDAGINFVPVDYVCEDLARVFRDPSQGGVHHSTVDDNMNLRVLTQTLAHHLGVENLDVQPVERFDLQHASAIERLMARRTEFYTSMTRFTKQFEKAAGPRWTLGTERIDRFVAEGIRALRKELQPQPEMRTVVTADGVSLNVHVAGRDDREAVVFINAIGMAAEIAAHLRDTLTSRYRFITWETRGIPSEIADIDAVNLGIDAHLSDLVTVLDHFGIEKAHVVGWCSGAYIAYHALDTDRILSLTLISGTYGFCANTDDETPFMRNLRHVLPLVAGSRQHAARYHAAFFARNPGHGTAADDARRTVEISEALDPALVHLTSKPFETPDLLYRYGCTIAKLWQHDRRVETGPLGVPCQILAGSVDETVTNVESRKLGEKHAGVRFVLIDGMDHYGVYNNPGLAKHVLEFLASVTGTARLAG